MLDATRYANATEILRSRALARPEQDALIWVRDPERRAAAHLSYRVLDEQARGIAVWLTEHFPAGSRILLLYPPAEFIVAFIGCLYAGMVAVPAPLPGRFPHERRRVRAIAANSQAAAVLTDSAHLAALQEWAAAEGLPPLPMTATDTGAVTGGEADGWTPPTADHTTLALLQYTSGSTGTPKGVMVSHGNLLVNAATMCEALEIPEGTRFGGWAPQYHDMGLMAQTLPALFLGSTCVLMDPTAFLKRPHHWLKMIGTYGIGWSAAPNFGYDYCSRKVTDEQLSGLDLSGWRYAVNGSEPVQAGTMTEFAKRFAAAGFRREAACPCYGLAESTVFVSGAPNREPVVATVAADALATRSFSPDPAARNIRELPSNGAAPQHDVAVVDPETLRRVPPGRIGELWLRGPNVAQGYWLNEEATEATFRARTADGDEGYLRTGDLGTVHHGEIYVTGRLKDLMIFRGRNLYPQDIEHELRVRHPELGSVGAVFAAPAIAEDTSDVEEVLVVTHEVRAGLGPEALAALAARVKQSVAQDFGVVPAAVCLLRRGGVRRTTSGKIERSAMRELFGNGELDSVYAVIDMRTATATAATVRAHGSTD
ncbi:Acyl-CoA synthetase (AMP-forming)/AMP-acid ligase II [Streptomyces sp. SceaMP-e96]|uniref:fatty acyl-AMP ligase n=1 Tax=Streptomyces TaxID=1883 RepID=UPI000823A11A|nr:MULTISPECIES: fatty acyl-AMP ligase [unclassified Streptomyces]MYT16157.1 AMP-binding protein [Streptomyces sp. SID4951]SCK30732.1 Acyl-CoA synthetase (AMP-forming)/AMP-acid ligase II [Streptomyces sp. SceaMP-e96]